MSRKSEYGRQRYVYDIDRCGIQRTPTEKRAFEKSVKRKKLQKKARRTNRH